MYCVRTQCTVSGHNTLCLDTVTLCPVGHNLIVSGQSVLCPDTIKQCYCVRTQYTVSGHSKIVSGQNNEIYELAQRKECLRP